MTSEVRNNGMERAGVLWRTLAVLVAFCLVLGQMNGGLFVAYATEGAPVTFQVGANVTAELSDGVLRLSGTGDTDDFTAETAPFKGHASQIRALEIEEGVTYVGSCLFYGLGELGGSLTLPGSIVGFGESAFSGEGPESSAHFSVVRNLFVSGEVVRPAQAQTAPAAEAEPRPQPEAAPEPAADEPAEDPAAGVPAADGTAPEPEALEAEPPAPAQADAPEPQAAPEPAESPSEGGYTVEQIAQQEIASPETLFGPGQDGMVVCSGGNATFLQAALSAGFQQADATATVVLDDAVELELPLTGGQLTLPEPPEQTVAAHEGESFAGWTQAPGDESAPVLSPGDLLPANDGDRVPLYSVWAPVAPLAEPASAADVKTIYVDQTNGKNENDGTTQDKAVKTLEKAATLLTPKADGGSVETNHIVIVGSYANASAQFLSVPVTLSGTGGTATFSVPSETSADQPLHLNEDLYVESIALKCNHIYAKGHSLTFGEGVKGSGFYLYGFGQNELDAATNDANITIKSGSISRIIGYVRSNPSVNGTGLTSTITIGGTASVQTIIAGNASGGVSEANVTINVEGGTVGTLAGGNQGFSTTSAPYSGKTTINVSGGTVTNLYGAGTGRNGGVPTFEGQLAVNVTGGTVKNLYGAGSAAYALAGTKANISVSGTGEVGAVFAAGRGWDAALSLEGLEASKADSAKFGSFSGEATISVANGATVGDIYASGEGDQATTSPDAGHKSNAYLDGNVTINVEGGTVTGSVYGGGKGIATVGYEQCARVTKDSKVEVNIADGTVEGNVYGGGQVADIEGSSSVTISGGTVEGNVYGGGEKGEVKGSTTVNVQKGTVKGSVFGGAYGEPDQILVLGGSTVNMTGGWVQGNVYGGSELSNDGAEIVGDNDLPDLVITNLVGGTVDGNVFGGGYKGIVNGSTHLHIGTGALGKCKHYQTHSDKKPDLTASSLSVGKSVYAGGDYGGDGKDYNAITVKGTSHVYIDGGGYETSNNASGTTMKLEGGVFGSGASCDAGSTRLVTLENYGEAVMDGNTVTGATRALDSIQRADRVVILNSHVQLIGQSDVANANQTAKYSLNRIGDHDGAAGLGELGNGLVLQGTSTLVLDSLAMELAAFRSVDANGKETTASSPGSALLLDTGTLLRVSYTSKDNSTVYGPVKGYTRLLAGNAADGYVYAAIGGTDGGFVGKDNALIPFTEMESATPPYRYWKVAGSGSSNAVREAVLTARTLESSDVGFGNDGYAVAKGVIELPPAEDGSTYTVKSVDVGSGLSLTDAAKDGQEESAVWKPEKASADEAKSAMSSNPLTTFGLFMKAGSGFESVSDDSGKVITGSSSSGEIGQKVSGDGTIPQIEFYLTYYNGIAASRDVGTVTVVLERELANKATETTTVNVQIVTRTTSLSALEADLYATQAGIYTGKIIIPSGSSRNLSLTGVKAENGVGLVSKDAELADNKFSISMQPVKGTGWQSAGFMSTPYDLGSFVSGSVSIGTTDSRYEAPIEFVLRNAGGFASKEAPDIVTLDLQEKGIDKPVQVTLNVHWEESAVSAVKVGPGRQYDSLAANEDLTISQYSAVTAAFTLKNLPVKDSWLELQNDKGASVALPSGTELTLLSGTDFYRYQAKGVEKDNKILLSDFTSMGSNAALQGSLEEDVTAIVDFGKAASQLELGKYSLRMRADKSADSTGADFTLNNFVATASISGGDGLSQGAHEFTVNVQLGNDTRFAGGAAVVLSPGAGESFPEGTVFKVGEAEYYPVNGKVSIPLGAGTSWNIVMDTTNTTGLAEGTNTLSAQVLPTGASAGNATPLPAGTATYNVTKNPSQSLSVTLEGSNRIVKPGAQLIFTADTKSSSESISVRVQEKKDNAYTDIADWGVSSASDGKITVTVPSEIATGTYRLLFTLGDQHVPFNIIVAG